MLEICSTTCDINLIKYQYYIKDKINSIIIELLDMDYEKVCCPYFIKYLENLDTSLDNDILENTSQTLNIFFNFIDYDDNKEWFEKNKDRLMELDKKLCREKKLERICK